ncbi:MAG: hypothetical protein ACE5HU_09390 [Acidobacteriota bacterium]
MTTKQIQKAFDRIFYPCPGAQYGGPPTTTHSGSIVVTKNRVHAASVFIEKSRRFKVDVFSDTKEMNATEILIPISLR